MSEKVFDFNKHKNKKSGVVTPEDLIENLNNIAKQGKVREIVYVLIDDEGVIRNGWSDINILKAIGLLEVSKMQLANDMYVPD